MAEEKIKDGLCLPSGFKFPNEKGFDPEVDLRQMVALNLSKNIVHECPILSFGRCKRSRRDCLPNKGNFSRVELLP